MKKLMLVCGLMLAFCSFGLSGPMPACSAGTLDAYVSLGATGCTVGSLEFSNFTFGASAAGTGTILPADSQITVTPQSLPNNYGFKFDAALSPNAGQSQDVTIDYVVRVLAGNPNITDSALSAEVNGSASANMTECLGGLLPACSGGVTTGLTVTPTQLSDSNTFNGVSTVGVGTDVSANGNATISGEIVQFSTGGTGNTVPEPASLMLFGSGMVGVAFLIRRKMSQPQ
ncbi:MAG: PEP-CTERM sorting domain-containing protein [Terriglobia bacterium]